MEHLIGLRPSGAVEDLKMYVCTLAMAYAGIKGEHSAQLALHTPSIAQRHRESEQPRAALDCQKSSESPEAGGRAWDRLCLGGAGGKLGNAPLGPMRLFRA